MDTSAVVRHPWLLTLALLLGPPGACVASASTPYAVQDGPSTDAVLPIHPDLQITRDPLFAAYFEARLELDQLSRDIDALHAILERSPDRVDLAAALWSIPVAVESTELRRLLDALTLARIELRAARARLDDDAPRVVDLQARIRSIEDRAIPNVVRGVLSELEHRQRELRDRVDDLSEELQEIPPSALEEARLIRRVQETERLYVEVRTRLDRARAAAESVEPDIRILDRAVVPARPSDTRLPLAVEVLLGCIAAAFCGALLLQGIHPRLGEDLAPLLAILVGAAVAVVLTLEQLPVYAPHPVTPAPPSPALESPPIPPAFAPPVPARPPFVPGPGVGPVMTPTDGEPRRILAVVGDEQAAGLGQVLAVRPTVVVVDEAGSAVRGAEVRFEVVSGGGLVAPASIRTDAFGRARAAWRLGVEPGVQKMTVSSPDLVETVTFTATARR